MAEKTEQPKEPSTSIDATEQGQCPDDDDNLEESTTNPESAGVASPAHSQGESPNRKSPDPSCSICLDKLKEPAVLDSCCHTFCYKCIINWSKVRTVCPLCQMKFKRIRRKESEYDFFERLIDGRAELNRMLNMQLNRNVRIRNLSFRRRCLLFGCRTSRRIDFLEAQEHRHIYAPHSVRSVPTNHERNPQEPRNIQFRRRVYSENLWVKSHIYAGYASPNYFQASQTAINRLVPWLTRELTALLNSEEQVGFILDLIMSLIMRYSIISEDFFFHVEPHFGNNTQHFVHEFWSFANSFFTMDQYDEFREYEYRNQMLASTETDVIYVESDDSEDNPPNMPVSPTMQPSRSSSDLSTIIQKQKRLIKLLWKKNSENTVRNISLTPPPPAVSPSPSRPSFPEDLTLPSSSRAFSDVSAATSRSAVTFDSSHSTITLSSEDDTSDSPIILDEVKPRCMKSLEGIQISSSSEPEIESALTPPLPDLELVSDGSLDVIGDGDDFDNSKALSPFNADEPTVDCVMPRERKSRKSSLNKKDRYVPISSKKRTRCSSSSSSGSRESKVGSWSPDRENARKFFRDNRRSLSSGLRFSEAIELGESSHKVRMADTDCDDRYSSSSSNSDTVKRKKLRSVVKKSCPRNRSFRSKKSKKKGKKKDKQR